MEYIKEDKIDQALEVISESDERYEAALKDLELRQPEVMDYLQDEEHTLAFTEDEQDYILYLLLVIWEAVRQVHPDLPGVSLEALNQAEEANWNKLEGLTEKKFRDRLDVFFDSTNQEDLLAFLEDALQEDEDSFVTKEAREPIFVLLKSIIDCWDRAVGVDGEGF